MWRCLEHRPGVAALVALVAELGCGAPDTLTVLGEASTAPGVSAGAARPKSPSVSFASTGACRAGACVNPTAPAAISAGANSTCALTVAGAVRCWGANITGQLGDGSMMSSDVPVDVVGLSSGVIAISAGDGSACALTTVGGVKCWGYNAWGQLGNGSTAEYSGIPVDVVGLSSGVVAVSTSQAGPTACALTAARAVKCWGHNSFGQLGDGTALNSNVPMNAVGLPPNILAISAGGIETCALTGVGAVKCWGQWGSRNPSDIAGLTFGVVAVSNGTGFMCAVTTAGAVKCVGTNTYGELGRDQTAEHSYTAANVVGLSSGVIAVSAGYAHACALTTTGAVKCWGYNAWGQIGDGSTAQYRDVPVDVVGLSSGVVAISAGGHHTCAVTASGGVKCWGMGAHGELGDGTTIESHVPVDVVGF
jgi:alpha-tubulin suppressor-like RCC1 family protein